MPATKPNYCLTVDFSWFRTQIVRVEGSILTTRPTPQPQLSNKFRYVFNDCFLPTTNTEQTNLRFIYISLSLSIGKDIMQQNNPALVNQIVIKHTDDFLSIFYPFI